MATLQSVLDDTRSHLREATARFYSDAELVRWINEGVREVNRRAETNLARIDIPTQPATQDYAAPPDTGRLHKLEWTQDNFATTYPLEAHSRFEMDAIWGTRQTSQYGTSPGHYSTFGQPPTLRITLFPVPSAAGVLRVYYYPIPTNLTTSQTSTDISLPQGWEDLVPLYAEYVAKRKGADPTWQEAKQLFEERLGHFVDLTRRWHDQASQWNYGTSNLPAWLVEFD